jgi:MFS family permease
VLLIREQPREATVSARSVLPWRNISDRGLAARIFVPNIVISLGAALLIPYMNLFFKETFRVTDKTLGLLFAVSAVITGTATLASPILADRWGRIRALVITQLASIPFLLTIGFSPMFSLSAIAFWVRAALMNMGSPLFEAFAMEQVQEHERATISGLMGMSWNIGWAVGPYVSGRMQGNPSIGFKPIFLITCSLYIVAALLERGFFQRRDDRQRRAAHLRKMGITDLTVSQPK